MEPEVRPPDLIGPLVGLRAWWIDRTGVGPRLVSLVPGANSGLGRKPWSWEPRRAPAALCLITQSGAPDHPAPEESCRCGFYASFEVARVRSLFIRQATPFVGGRPMPLCVGEVNSWGKVIRHERGLRSERAYPKRLFLLESERAGVDQDLAGALCEAYGVPAQLVPWELRGAWGTTEWDEVAEAYGVPTQLPGPFATRPAQGFDSSV